MIAGRHIYHDASHEHSSRLAEQMNYVELLQPELLTRQQAWDLLRDYEGFYTYLLWRADKTPVTPFYVGKGTKWRMFQHTAPTEQSHNLFRRRVIEKLGDDTLLYTVLFANSEEEAHEREIELIALIGRRNRNAGPLTNLTDGGEGTVGHIGLRGAENPKARSVTIEGVIYPSAVEAEQATGVDRSTIWARCRAGWPAWFYTDEGQRQPTKDLLLRYRRAIYVDGRLYQSLPAAVAATGMSRNRIWKRIQNGWGGYRYANEEQRERTQHEKPVEVHSVLYESQKAAAAAIGISTGALRKRLSSSLFPGYVDLTGRIQKREVNTVTQPKLARVNDQVYESISAAAEAYGITGEAVLNRAGSSNFPDWMVEGVDKVSKGAPAIPLAVTVDGIRYASQSDAARAHGIDVNTVKTRCASPSFPNYSSLSIPQKWPKDGKPSLLGVRIDGATYRSLNAASKALNVIRQTIKARCESEDWPTWEFL
jgi:predicted DNA-binding transcriptional regulator AlpA